MLLVVIVPSLRLWLFFSIHFSCLSFVLFFFSSRRRHTRCALVTGVQTCALPILPADRRRLSLDAVRRTFEVAGPAEASERELLPVIDRASAVLAPLYEVDGELHVILTRRTWNLSSHQGEVSFPGGRHDDTDPDLWYTALREAREEIALDTSDVRCIGEHDHLSSEESRVGKECVSTCRSGW